MKQLQLTILVTSILIPGILFGADKPCNARSFLGENVRVLYFNPAAGPVNIGGVQVPSEVMELIMQKMPQKLKYGHYQYCDEITLLA